MVTSQSNKLGGYKEDPNHRMEARCTGEVCKLNIEKPATCMYIAGLCKKLKIKPQIVSFVMMAEILKICKVGVSEPA